MKIGDIEVKPLAAESMGVRSLCNFVTTPDVSILFDPSAALAFRPPCEPHPEEYRALERALERIRTHANSADVLSVSHYHFDHVRPRTTNWRYNFSSIEDLQCIFGNKRILAKDSRENINPSQRRRAFYFEKDLQGISDISWADGLTFAFDNTTVSYSKPLAHGPDNSRLGYVLATLVEYGDHKVLFAPDVQGPISKKTLSYILNQDANLIILGGPPVYLKRFSEHESQAALYSLTTLATVTSFLVVDHHLMRSADWKNWIAPIRSVAERSGNELLCMADLAGVKPLLLESERNALYTDNPPSDDFMNWLASSDEFKIQNRPPI
ncbi:MAG: hypothetical protein P1Q69_04120 [Candidatus Thorarchaeota archaeon]|nr:hypothetical protein [Candidatus Thorarchaeota archaeon]